MLLVKLLFLGLQLLKNVLAPLNILELALGYLRWHELGHRVLSQCRADFLDWTLVYLLLSFYI